MGRATKPSAVDRRDLAFAGVARQAELVRAGEVTPRELVEMSLERIAALDPQLNAFRVVFAERALREADAAGRRVSAAADLPLLGVPIAVKDDTPVGGEAKVCGSHAHGEPEPEDAAFVGLLRAAGAIVVGITRTPELAAWPFCETAHGGITRNPWNLDRTSGGSSGGSASAVAAALVPAATASDGAGSIRIPAACCGLFGLKVTRGAITTAPAQEIFGGLSVYGFLTRGVADAALLYEIATGRPFVAAAQQDPPRLRIALSTRIPPGSSARLNGEWRSAAESSAELLRSLGHEVIEREPPIGPVGLNMLARYLAGIDAEAKAMAHPDRLERRTRRLALLGRVVVRPAARARRRQDADAARVNAIF
ncbi:MAG TPA: amidase family protein, partial [Solirubrobacteraceae bacterium]|nr:amidase family protein [Solirubrobacteraceae bacterium]